MCTFPMSARKVGPLPVNNKKRQRPSELLKKSLQFILMMLDLADLISTLLVNRRSWKHSKHLPGNNTVTSHYIHRLRGLQKSNESSLFSSESSPVDISAPSGQSSNAGEPINTVSSIENFKSCRMYDVLKTMFWHGLWSIYGARLSAACIQPAILTSSINYESQTLGQYRQWRVAKPLSFAHTNFGGRNIYR